MAEMSTVAAACLEYVRQQQLELHLQDVASLVSANPRLDLHRFLPDYFKTVVTGQHVVGRHYAYASGSMHNRCHLLAAILRSLQHLPPRLGLTQGDYHCLLQLLCPDLPLSVVKNAWTTAHTLQAGRASQATTGGAAAAAAAGGGDSPEPEPMVTPVVFLAVFSVTFLYEHFLLAVRRNAFDANKSCLGTQQLQEAVEVALQQVPEQGWPVPHRGALTKVQQQLDIAQRSSRSAVLFSDFVRALCQRSQVAREVQQLLQATASAATLALDGVLSPRKQPSVAFSSDESSGEEAPPTRRQQQQHRFLRKAGSSSSSGGGNSSFGRAVSRSLSTLSSRSAGGGSSSRPLSGSTLQQGGTGGSNAAGNPWK